jgi:cytochrome c-type biogenesis protein CcmH
MRRLLLILALTLAPLAAAAVEPEEMLDDPALEARARAISAEVRCVVCQNETIDTSNAGVAKDLRLLIRERLLAGDTDQEVYDHLVARYGDFVLFRPPMRGANLILWFAPVAIFGVAGGAVALWLVRRPRRPAEAERGLTPEEEAALARLDQRR